MKPNQFLLIVMFVVSFGHNSSVLALNSNEKKQNEVYCKNFQSGSFVNQCSSGHTSKFKRLNGVQVQEYGNFYLKEKNVWTAPCEYRNTLLETNDPEIRLYVGNSINIKMANVTKTSYRTIEANSGDKNIFCEVKKIGEIDPSTTL
ncbi:hypothetical protein EHQ94_00915 [Leptospira meyeri]|uniref:hypothetical protein n=1 Tax=Leptospira meyeri TaxID=29508 RepID=UPI001083C051|nr:hypothetical protein [Leptospira meyeri]MCW7489276.1 hypothetical protein [Leptospira meyeri]TGM66675.1 hypothetical protein EHQ93_01260 [Leptospira meyeri]TGM73722.1 hypothetical protein EHQ94_00915 [Leptospira meyeri]